MWSRVSSVGISEATSSVCTVGAVLQQCCFPMWWTVLDLSTDLEREACSKMIPGHQGGGFRYLHPFCALIFGLRVFSCRERNSSAWWFGRQKEKLSFKSSLCGGGGRIVVTGERMNSSLPHKLPICVQRTNVRAPIRADSFGIILIVSGVLSHSLHDGCVGQSCCWVCLSNLFDFLL